MVKYLLFGILTKVSFSPLLILFMVKLPLGATAGYGGFSPLLILFMVKLRWTNLQVMNSFSPLLILFMVKWM